MPTLRRMGQFLTLTASIIALPEPFHICADGARRVSTAAISARSLSCQCAISARYFLVDCGFAALRSGPRWRGLLPQAPRTNGCRREANERHNRRQAGMLQHRARRDSRQARDSALLETQAPAEKTQPSSGWIGVPSVMRCGRSVASCSTRSCGMPSSSYNVAAMSSGRAG